MGVLEYCVYPVCLTPITHPCIELNWKHTIYTLIHTRFVRRDLLTILSIFIGIVVVFILLHPKSVDLVSIGAICLNFYCMILYLCLLM